MENNQEKRSKQTENEKQPGDMASFNQRDTSRSTETEGAKKEEKDEGESFMNHNGNSKANAPGKERE